MDWRMDAECRDADPEIFFAVGSTGPAARQIEQAKEICHDCPVECQCRNWALDTGEPYGVLGGLSEDERRALLRQPRLSVWAT
jgi:WhiB family redox-sensing transcriptional regulator